MEAACVELLTLEEFLERVKLGRSTVYAMVKDGRLRPGHHFVTIGSNKRFVWPDAVRALQEAGRRQVEAAAEPATPPHRSAGTANLPKGPRGRRRGPAAVNLDYGMEPG